VPTVTNAYNQTALPSDLIPRFDQSKAIEYRVFNIRTVISLPVAGAPAFLRPIADIGHYRVLEAPGEGYFGLVDVVAAADTTRDNFYDLNDPWLHGDWPEKNQYIWLDFHGEAPKDLPRVTAGYFPPVPASSTSPGAVLNERQNWQVYEADLDVQRPAWVLFRMTYHPNWKLLVDGQQVKTTMLSPGFVGAQVAAGRHHVVCRYVPGNNKLMLALAGFGLVLLMGAFEYGRHRVKLQKDQ